MKSGILNLLEPSGPVQALLYILYRKVLMFVIFSIKHRFVSSNKNIQHPQKALKTLQFILKYTLLAA
jgi:hypothetical protein